MLLALALLAQATSSDRLPPANPIPYTEPGVANVMAPVSAALAAIGRHDAAALAQTLRPDAVLTEAPADAAPRRLSADDLARSPLGTVRLTDPAVEQDGDIAMVWSPYAATGRCGTIHADLVRDAGRWRINALTWTTRTGGCAAG